MNALKKVLTQPKLIKRILYKRILFEGEIDRLFTGKSCTKFCITLDRTNSY